MNWCMTGTGLVKQLCVISNYLNGCADTRWFGCVSGLGGGVGGVALRWSLLKAPSTSLCDGLSVKHSCFRLRWLHWVLLPPRGVSQVTPHPLIRTAGTPARAAICKLLLSFFLVHFDCPIFASLLPHRLGWYSQGRPFLFVLMLSYHFAYLLIECIHKLLFECLSLELL